MFKHVLIRDVAYESLPRKERSRAHVETAAWIEETSGERAGEFAELLAHHYDAAYSFAPGDDVRRKARSACLAAGQVALRRFAIEQGERFALRAVELSEVRVSGSKRWPRSAICTSSRSTATERFRPTGMLSSSSPPTIPTSRGLPARPPSSALAGSEQVTELAPTEEVAGMIESGLEAAGPDQGKDRTLLLINKGFLVVQREQGRSRSAETAVSEALRAAEQLDQADLLSAALDLVQLWEKHGGRYGEGHRATLRRLELVPRMADVKEIGDTYAMAAEGAYYLGRYAEAEESASACIERSRGVDSGSYLHGLTWRVSARFTLGKWDDALADHGELERLAAQDPRELPAGYTMRAMSSGRSATSFATRPLTPIATSTCAAGTSTSGETARCIRLVHAPAFALVLAHQGLFEEAVALCPLTRHAMGAGTTLQVLCEIVAAQGSWDDAPRIVAAARAEAEIGEQLSVPLHADRLEGRAAAAAGNAEQAVLLLRRSAAGFAELGARWEEAWSRLLLAEVLVDSDSQEAGRELEPALSVFEELRSVREAERAHRLLADKLA